MTDFLAFLSQQEMFIGLAGATVVGALMFALRALPGLIWNRLSDFFTVTLVIEHREAAFRFIDEWLSKQDAVKNARRLMIAETFEYEAGRWQWKMTLGRGWHLLRYGRAWLLIHREVKDGGDFAEALGKGPQQRFWIRSVGRSQDALNALFKEAKEAYFGDGLLKVFIWDGGWECVDRRRPRSLDSVFMPAEQKARVVSDMDRFLTSRDWYAARGVPWRRGYLFKGQPGTGKTTLIAALAGRFGRSVCALNLNNIQNDNQLIAAFNHAPHDGVIVIEDIDTAKITHDREKQAEKEEKLVEAGVPQPDKQQTGVTLSGLLNAIDGLASREGRILFITSNCPDKLDPALLRPGRVDVDEEIGLLGRAEAEGMIEAFGASPDVMDEIVLPIPAAALQSRLLKDDASADVQDVRWLPVREDAA